MALQEAPLPDGPLYRLGRAPDPLAWIDWRYTGSGRFDDPVQPPRFRAMYLAEQRLACFIETLAAWRPKLDLLERLAALPPGDRGNDVPWQAFGRVPRDWPLLRRIGAVRLHPHQRWLDLRVHEARETLRAALAPQLLRLGYDDLDLGDTLSRDRQLTRMLAEAAVDDGFNGVVYKSRFDHAFDCLALLDGATFDRIDERPLMSDDPDLLDAMRRLALSWEDR
jgi:hypothetical protein